MDGTEARLNKRIKEFAPLAELFPSVVIIQQLEPFKSLYMNSRGLNELGVTLEELRAMGPDYLGRFFNLEDSEDYLKKLKSLLSKNDTEETFTFFQQVKFKDEDQWIWHIGSTRIFFQNKLGQPSHIITIAIPIDKLKHIPNKAERLLAERNFFHSNLAKFLTLSKREREVLKLVAIGKTSSEIANELFISDQTVKSHRKIIKQKLQINSGYDFTIYAHAYDLI